MYQRKNNFSELLKMQLESKSRSVHIWGTRSGFISTHAVITGKAEIFLGSLSEGA